MREIEMLQRGADRGFEGRGKDPSLHAGVNPLALIDLSDPTILFGDVLGRCRAIPLDPPRRVGWVHPAQG